MNFAYRNEQLLIRDTVRAFVRTRIVPNADRWNEKEEFPRELGGTNQAATVGMDQLGARPEPQRGPAILGIVAAIGRQGLLPVD